MKQIQKNLKAVVLLNLIMLSTVLFSQVKRDNFGIETKDMKKLFFKVKVFTLNNQVKKGFLNALNDTSVVISTTRHISINKKKTETLEIPITQIKSLRIAKCHQYYDAYLKTQAGFILGSLITDVTIGIIDYDELMITWLSAGLALITVPLVFIAAVFVNRAHDLKIKLYRNLDRYQFELANIHAYMEKKNDKKVNFLALENRVRKKLK